MTNVSTQVIWLEFSEAIQHFIRTKVSNQEHVKDLLQEVFLKVHLKLPTVKNTDRLTSWLYTIARNVVNDYYRAKYKEGEIAEEYKYLVEEYELGEAEKEHLFCCLNPFIQELEPTYRDTIQLLEEGKSQKEVAEILQISYSGAKSRIQRAREILKTQFVSCCKYKIGEDGKLYGEQDCAHNHDHDHIC